ncbi:MAG: glycosyltransferase [Paracoccaceae bacterium]
MPRTRTHPRPIGYFCHHQGRGHAVRAAAIANAVAARRSVTLFCARPDIFPRLREGVSVIEIPSLFEPRGDEAPGLATCPQPETVHCAPLGWPGIRQAMGQMTAWFAAEDPALMICDVSAEVAQLARLCSVPHVCVLQHGTRGDAGHRAAWDGAVGLIAPFAEALAQPDWPRAHRDKTCFAPGLGIASTVPRPLVAPVRPFVLVISGKGGDGIAEAPLAVAARTFPELDWISIGEVRRDWHATPPGNLHHAGWVDDAPARIAQASLIVASTGNSTCHQILAAGKPWIAVPEWRYFDEQVEKARALANAKAALHLPNLPASGTAWRDAVAQCTAMHDPARQRALLAHASEAKVADWIEHLVEQSWGPDRVRPAELPSPQTRTLDARSA